MSRSYESNGPDVKVRGTAAHIAEKYMQLARDANASGDPVLAESYLQHAEHYFRVIAAAQSQFQQPGAGESQPPHRYNGGGRFDSAEDEGDDGDEQEAPRPVSEPAPPPPSQDQASAPAEADEQTPDEQPTPAPRRRRRRNVAEQTAAGEPSQEAPKPRGRRGNGQAQPDAPTSSEDVGA